jgi:hypothetical protein
VSAFPTKALCSPRFADGADPELVTDPLFIAGLDISPEHLEESKAAVLREIERRRQVYSAAAWVSPNGRARVLRGAMVTADRYPLAPWSAYATRR